MSDASSVCAALDALRAAERRVGGWQAGAAGAALGLLFPLVLASGGWALAGALLVWGAYFGRKAYGAAHTLRATRQIRLERRFVQQPFGREALRRCLRQEDHLWSSSLVLGGLRRLDAYPLGQALPASARVAGTQQRFRQALRPLQPPAWGLDAGAALLLAATAVGLGAARSALGAGALVALLVAEGMAAALREPLRRQWRRLVRALGAWARAAGGAAAPPPRAYHHTLLYYARPWFGPSEETERAAGKETAVTEDAPRS